METLKDKIDAIISSSLHFIPELQLGIGIIFIILIGLFTRRKDLLAVITVVIFALSFYSTLSHWESYRTPVTLYMNMLRSDSLAGYLKLLFDLSGILTVWMTWKNNKMTHRVPEYYALLTAVVFGSHLLVMSVNFVMVFISLELISIASYVLAGFSFSKHGAEGSLKYFLFGSVSSAIMLYGFTMIYGITGMLNFVNTEFATELLNAKSGLLFISALLALCGFFYKIAAVPLHPWAPDVYEAAPMPVIAFFSVVPKLAGMGILTRFTLSLGLDGHPVYDWQNLIAVVAMLSITVGNFSALWQKSAKRLMAYSSVAQSGFLLVGISSFLLQGVQFMLFYATIYAIANFLVFIYLQSFECEGIDSLESFSGVGKSAVLPSIFILIGLISLTGLPPTAGFTAKFFVFTSLWESYQSNGKSLLLWLLVFGLINTVISLFYYIRIPYYAFIKGGKDHATMSILRFENLLGLLLVLLILILFFIPGLLMGWINKINFVL